jgi:putative ABC transport system permease protein
MLNSSLRITLRKLYRERLYALINIAGLSLGVACCLILGLYLRSELTFDQHNLRHKQIYRVVNEFNANGKVDGFAVTSPALGLMLKEEYPEIQAYVRLRNIRQKIFYVYEDQSYGWDDVYIADDNIFQVFTHDIIYGDPDTALTDPGSIAVSRTFARKYFGDGNPIGKTLHGSESSEPFKISLVFADQPENSHVRYDVLVSYNRKDVAIPDNITARRQQLFGVSDYTYLVLPEDYPIEDFRKISEAFFARHMEAQGKVLNWTWRSWLQPLADIHLYSDLAYDEPGGNRISLYGFAAVAVFILLVACINYMNLATARSAKRAREVGMRKILGAGRGRLVFQFLWEALCFTLIALVLGVILVEVALTLTPVTTLLGKPLTLNLTGEPALLGWLLVLGLVIGLLSGLYPALYLSSVMPLSALIGSIRAGKASIRLREFLVLVQFIISVGVIACTLLMAAQMRYVADKSLGFAKENRVTITLRGVDLIKKIPTIKNELLKNNHILAVSAGANILGDDMPINGMPIEKHNGEMETTTLSHMGVADDYIAVMGMNIVEGRDFSTKFLTDVGMSFVVNEALVNKMGWDEPLGKRMQNGRVIGVVQDFHFKSLHSQIEPFALHPFQDNFDNVPEQFRPFILRHLVLNIAGEDIRRTLKFLEQKFVEFDPRHPFEFSFVDDALDKLYLSEQRLMKLTGIFAGICIFIACLGLFGLAAFTTEQRTREIGIRKILGATTAQIILLLARNIMILVLAGAVIAAAVSWLVINEWLSGFAYRTAINPLVFVLSAALAAAVAYITLALQSFKTARANPVESLRYE